MKKPQTVFFLILIAGFAILLRGLHLLSADHYYIISPDSYFFHWQAVGVLSSQSIPLTWHSGLTYPLVYFATFISFISGLAPSDALTFAGKLMPPMLGIVSIVVVYLGTSRMYGPRAGLWSAFSWSVLAYTVVTQVAGYLDRDGLSMLLLMIGVFLFYFASRWQYRVGGKDIGWAAGAVAIAVVSALLYLEWLWLGPLLLLIVVSAFVVAEVLIDLLFRSLQTTTDGKDAAGLTRAFLTNAAASIQRSSWRPLVLVLGLLLTAATIYPGISNLYQSAGGYLKDILSGTAGVAELRHLTADDVLGYGFLIIPLAIGFYTAVTSHRRSDLLCLSWFASICTFGLFANRIFLYAAPGACIICGLGLASVFSFRNVSKAAQQIWIGSELYKLPSLRLLKTCGAILLLVALIAMPTQAALHIGSSYMTAADNAWVYALVYLRENSPADSIVMTWWDRGYWILDIADRRPVVDNGLYGWDDQRLEDVGLVYCTAQPTEGAGLMQKYGADYLIFWREDVAILPGISEYGLGEPFGDGTSVPPELRESLYCRSLYGHFTGEGGLRRIYPAPEVEDPEIVILALD